MSTESEDLKFKHTDQTVKEEPETDQELTKSNHETQNEDEMIPTIQTIEGVDEKERLEIIRQIEFYFTDANLPYDKFMFLQSSPHLDPVKAPNMTAEEKKKAEDYGPGCSPVLFQTVASFKRMRPFTSKYPTSKLVQIIESSTTEPKLVEIMTQELNGKPTFYIRRILKLEETNRAGASDRCIYVKGFLSEEDLEKEEPAHMQSKLEQWAKQWGAVAVLRMRRQNPVKHQKDNESRDKKWKNSVFIEYREPDSAEKLVNQFKQESDKPKFDGRELSSVMFKIDYVTMKAEEKGLPPPAMSGKRQAGDAKSSGYFGGNNSLFNAFKELKAIAAGAKQYAGVPASSKKTTDEEKFIEYEGNKLLVNNDGTLKNPGELKTFPSDTALGFELQGEAPADFKEARINYSDLKKALTMDDLVCHVVHLVPGNHSKGTVGFTQSISDERMAEIQAKGIQSGGRSVTFMRLNDEEVKKYHLDCATLKAKSVYAPKNNNNNNRQQKSNRGDRNGRGCGRGGRGGGKGQHGGRRGNDRNAATETDGRDETTVIGNKRDAEGNVVSSNGGTNSNNSVPEIGRAPKKSKTSS